MKMLGFFLAIAAFGAPPKDVRLKVSQAINEKTGHFLVLFHQDVPATTAERLIFETNLLRIERPDLLAGHYLLLGTLEKVARLAENDEVAYLYPASEDVVAGNPVQGCSGPSETAGPAMYVSSQGQGWDGEGQGRASLTFSISGSNSHFRGLIEKALAEWSKHARIDFSFTNTPGERNLNFLIAARAHGDGFSFDGRGKILAHTFYPSDRTPEPLAGDIHLDDDEPWTTRQDPDLYSVILHEIGHALGLGHSDRPGAVMYPYYRRVSNLQVEDVKALQRLYEARLGDEPVVPTTPEPAPLPAPLPPPPVPVTPNQADTASPALVITNPASLVYTTSASTFRIAGTARDASGIAEVRWTTPSGLAGIAAGTTNWKTEPIALAQGDNRITMVAFDTAGNSTQRTVVITRR